MDIMNGLLLASGTLKSDLECYGQNRIRTPTVDAWAAQSMNSLTIISVLWSAYLSVMYFSG